jgi:glycosyltransferase involved in cell wall biosynthesis
MVHEAFLAFGRSWRQCAVALVHRVMTAILLQSVERVWVSTPECERRWKPYALGRGIPFQWQPVPNNIDVVHDPAGIQTVRNRYAADGPLIGHFGTYGAPVASVLEPILLKLAAETSGDASRSAILLMGMGSQEFRRRQLEKSPEVRGRLHATGALSAGDLSRHISACDLMIQPYPDGVTTRRGTLMASLNHEKAIVTTAVPGTDPIWIESNAVALALAGDADAFVNLVNELCANADQRARLARAAATLYRDRFDIIHTITALRLTKSAHLTCVS